MGFTKNLAIFGLSLLIVVLAFWWSGAFEVFGMGGPIEFIFSTISLIPNWLWGIIIIFVVGGILIERFFE